MDSQMLVIALVVGAVSLLMIGDRLPNLGRRLGRGIVEFKRQLKDVEDRLL